VRARLFPSPWLSAALVPAWLMLNGSTSVGNWLLAGLLAWAIPWLTAAFRPDVVRIKAPGALVRLTGVVLYDIAKSNVDVARRVLGPEAAMSPRFVWVPLDIRSPHGIVALAGIITLTPGTVSSALAEDRRHLLVHALHCPDADAEAALVVEIKARYETPLREIFE
jgi:multicomponent K+:H+ antiporter subunit E